MESRWFQRKGGRGEDENRGCVLESKGGPDFQISLHLENGF